MQEFKTSESENIFSVQIKKLLAAVYLKPIPITFTLEGHSLRENKMTH